MSTRYLFTFRNLGVSKVADEYLISRLSDSEPIYFTRDLCEAVNSLLAQSDTFTSAPDRVRVALVGKFLQGDVEFIEVALASMAVKRLNSRT